MDKDEIEIIVEAQEKLQEVIASLELVFCHDKHVQAYLIDHLKIIASSDHGFLSKDLNMDDLIYQLDAGNEG